MQNDDLEKMLQAGLKSYCEAEPLVGLEERVLRRVEERCAGNRWMWFRWVAATACACLVLLVVFGLERDWRKKLGSAQSTIADALPSRAPVVDLPSAVEQPSPHRSDGMAANVPERQAVHAHGGIALVPLERKPKRKELPKLNMFPTPHPLTPEERALVEFVNQHPEEAVQLAEAKRRSSEPIQIAAIHIEPLKIDGPQQ